MTFVSNRLVTFGVLVLKIVLECLKKCVQKALCRPLELARSCTPSASDGEVFTYLETPIRGYFIDLLCWFLVSVSFISTLMFVISNFGFSSWLF